jgi:hypothetical protein
MRVCQETIYTALCTLPRGELCDEQLKTLRQGREASRPHAHGEPDFDTYNRNPLIYMEHA